MNSAQSSKLPSERSFGCLCTAVFAGVAFHGYAKGWGQTVWIAWLVASSLSGLVTLFTPHLLRPFNKAWFQLGQLLGKIVTPIVLGVLFFGIITPIACITRLSGRDELRLKRRVMDSFWLDRTPPDPDCNSFKNQF